VTRACLALALAAVVLAATGCGGDEATTGFDGANRTAGKELFIQGANGKASCGSCHTLADAGTVGTVGPNLDQAFGYVCEQGFAEDTVYSVVLGQIDLAQGEMPQDLVTGQDADDVAAYVASVAGKDVPGCTPSGAGGGTTATTTTQTTGG
jgi:mono/diheme cytochrome c family protein